LRAGLVYRGDERRGFEIPHACAWGFIFFVLPSIAVDIHTFAKNSGKLGKKV
jgi:hypothetical protein